MISNIYAAESGERARFAAAVPVWLDGREREMNLFVGFRAAVAKPKAGAVMLRITACSVYRALVNGEFAGYGPARGPKGFHRIDEWDITDLMKPGRNIIAVEVAGYNANGYYLPDQPSFIQAEVIAGGDVLAATGGNSGGFTAHILAERVRKVYRYSFQRPFTECYNLDVKSGAWRVDTSFRSKGERCAKTSNKKLLPRGVPYLEFALRGPVRDVARGKLKFGVEPEMIWKDRSATQVGAKYRGFTEEEIEVRTMIDIQRAANSSYETIDSVFNPAVKLKMRGKSWRILDLGANLTGFIGAEVTCRKPTRLLILFDELLTGGDVDFKRMNCVNIVEWNLPEGSSRLESFEPYTMRYMKIVVLEGDCSISEPFIREYVGSSFERARFASSDPGLNRTFEAGRENLRQNALDIFMDCPSRERAGWLCDSFFTARAAFAMSGDAKIERNFLENYLLPKKFPNLPDGMLPMCYPADHPNGMFIPNWALWFVVELEEYLARSGDRAMVDALRDRVMRLFDYFKRFINEDGLLEKLESWVFIEWSMANKFTQDVNYPSNMLYAGALDAAGRIYGDRALLRQAERIRETIRRRSFDGNFFIDNAVREGGALVDTSNRTETCQYYAFYFDAATPESHPELWRTLCEEFGPDHAKRGLHPEIHPANAFIGNMLRMEILSRYGRRAQVLDESAGYWLYMAERTGTLWENADTRASCNHGFASHVSYAFYRDILGVERVDPVARRILLRFSDLPLQWCEGVMPIPGGDLRLAWRREGDTLLYRFSAPAGYQIKIECEEGINLKFEAGSELDERRIMYLIGRLRFVVAIFERPFDMLRAFRRRSPLH